MRMPSSVVLCLLLLAAAPLVAQSDNSVDLAIAMKFYPVRLDDQWRATHAAWKPVTRIARPLRIDFDKSGKEDYLAVAYSNGLVGSVRILKGYTADTATLVTEINDPVFGGNGRPFVDQVDMDNDGVPELVVQFSHSSYIYKYAGGALSLFGPTRTTKFGTTSKLGDVCFLDTNGDGTLEILERVSDPVPGYIVWQFDESGHFRRSASLAIFADLFERRDGEPVSESRPFGATPGTGYVLRVTNGDQAGGRMVTSAEVRLNGTTVLMPNDFRKSVRTLSVPITLAADNDLTVDLRSDPGTFISVVVIRP